MNQTNQNETTQAIVSLINKNNELEKQHQQLKEVVNQQGLELNFLQTFIKTQMDLNNCVPEHILNTCKNNLDNCPVCLETKDKYQFMRCGHLICDVCLGTITSMPKQHRKCPVCRRKISFKLKELDEMFDVYIMEDLTPYQQLKYDIENSKSELTKFVDDDQLHSEYYSSDD